MVEDTLPLNGAIRSITIGANWSPLVPIFVAIGANGAIGKNSRSLWHFYRILLHIVQRVSSVMYKLKKDSNVSFQLNVLITCYSYRIAWIQLQNRFAYPWPPGDGRSDRKGFEGKFAIMCAVEFRPDARSKWTELYRILRKTFDIRGCSLGIENLITPTKFPQITVDIFILNVHEPAIVILVWGQKAKKIW